MVFCSLLFTLSYAQDYKTFLDNNGDLDAVYTNNAIRDLYNGKADKTSANTWTGGNQLYGSTTFYQMVNVSTLSAANVFNINTAGAKALSIDASGRITKPLNTLFSVALVATQNNWPVGVTQTINFDNIVNVGGTNFVASTFTAPVPGYYLFDGCVTLENVDSGATYYRVMLICSVAGTFEIGLLDPSRFSADVAYYSFGFSQMINLAVGETVILKLNQTGGASQTDVRGTADGSRWHGCLLQ